MNKISFCCNFGYNFGDIVPVAEEMQKLKASLALSAVAAAKKVHQFAKKKVSLAFCDSLAQKKDV